MDKFYKNKRLFLCVLFVFICGVIAYFKFTERPKYKGYANNTYKFSFAYPSSYAMKQESFNTGVSLKLEGSKRYINIRASVASSDFLQFRVDRGNDIRFGNNVWKYDPPNEFCDGYGPCARLRGQYGIKHAGIYYIVDAFDEDNSKEDLRVILTSFSLFK